MTTQGLDDSISLLDLNNDEDINSTRTSIPKPIHHKQQAFNRPDDWLGSPPTGIRRKTSKSWRVKGEGTGTDNCNNSFRSNNSFHSAPPKFQTWQEHENSSVDAKGLQPERFIDRSSHGSSALNRENLVIATKPKEMDSSLHSILTEDSRSRFSETLKMWNSSASSLHESTGSVNFKAEPPYSPPKTIRSLSVRKSKDSSSTNEALPELDESSSSSIASNSVVSAGTVSWKGAPTKPACVSKYQNGGFHSIGKSSSPSASTSHPHQFRGYNRPDEWVGAYGKASPSKRSWRVKRIVDATKKGNEF
mmetsp:Transcript_13719/g.24606  ORF Transcript_13719/g.24606 Transcript_13719/m.24606 type:complete len:305 (+) Transcript_13719:50-964(+)